MELPFEHGHGVIQAMLKKRGEDRYDDMMFQLYFLSQPYNRFNSEHETLGDFKASLSAEKPPEPKASEIMDSVKNILNNFNGGD
jgi:hypothetical protein